MGGSCTCPAQSRRRAAGCRSGSTEWNSQKPYRSSIAYILLMDLPAAAPPRHERIPLLQIASHGGLMPRHSSGPKGGHSIASVRPSPSGRTPTAPSLQHSRRSVVSAYPQSSGVGGSRLRRLRSSRQEQVAGCAGAMDAAVAPASSAAAAVGECGQTSAPEPRGRHQQLLQPPVGRRHVGIPARTQLAGGA